MIQLEPWIPYMGNKASLLGNIEATIKQLAIPNPTCIVDAFCGGGSFGYYMATRGYKVIMNDLDPGVINLHKSLQMHPERLELFKKVAPTKEEFKACVNGNSDYDAYVKYIWSFGTKGDTYLTSLENEANKIEEYWRGEAEPNSRVKHLEDIVLMYAHCKPDITFVNGSYDELEIPEGALVYCFTPDHEVLTQRGWVNIKDVLPGDMVFSREPGTGKLDWVKNVLTIKKYYEGKMYEYDSSRVSLCVSPEHKLFVKTTKEQFILAKDAPKKYFSWIRGGGKWLQETKKAAFTINGVEYNKVYFAELLGLFLTDGSVNNQGTVLISQTKEKTRARLKFLFDKLNIAHTVMPRGFYIKKPFARWFMQFSKKENRNIPREILDESKEVLAALLAGIIEGDGTVETTGRARITIGSKPLVDNIIELAYKIGLSASYSVIQPKCGVLKNGRIIRGTKPYYSVAILRTDNPLRVKAHEKFVDYSGNIYCCTLEKWHTILVRRKGKTIWCGQCDPPYINTGEYLMDSFDHGKFYQWLKEQKEIVLVSEYTMPDEFPLIDAYNKNCVMAGADGRKATIEKLFANRELPLLRLF